MNVNVERDRCCSSGQCVMTVPEVFEQDDQDGLVRVLLNPVPAPRFADVRLAAELCPGGAITVTEDDDGARTAA
ncbi:ferredoxin [Kitasatospora purpeofusca]|uniref:ferredoxin n=1 Tax=Kitasatospora purpeofusca TaxID=67352 RepID=UPI002A59EEEF|nr:ferredoxin [Kitasatospora purpeofusca]MDY0816506.1 ferredoxin [Kitasatospora purpeofusca]